MMIITFTETEETQTISRQGFNGLQPRVQKKRQPKFFQEFGYSVKICIDPLTEKLAKNIMGFFLLK